MNQEAIEILKLNMQALYICKFSWRFTEPDQTNGRLNFGILLKNTVFAKNEELPHVVCYMHFWSFLIEVPTI